MQLQDTIQGVMHEVHFRTSKSGGHGGQNVNKRETKVELTFPIYSSHYLSSEQKSFLMQRAHEKGYMVDKEQELHITSQEERYQHRNKEHAVKKFRQLLTSVLQEVETKPLQNILHGNHYHGVVHPVHELWSA